MKEPVHKCMHEIILCVHVGSWLCDIHFLEVELCTSKVLGLDAVSARLVARLMK